MKVEERRKSIVNLLLSEGKAIAGGELSRRFSVSRQIIVQDISMLKEQGYDIISTHRGYVLHKSPLAERVFRVKHTADQTVDELSTVVDLGGTVADVFVQHQVYGKISATLNIFSRLHVQQFLEAVRSGRSSELMNVTDGYHYHTVRAESEELLDLIEAELDKKGYLVKGL
jgi:transcriptional regulator of NAD metabolism